MRSTLGPDAKTISDPVLALRAEALCEAAKTSQKERSEILIIETDDGERTAILWMGETVDDYTGEPRAFVLNVFVTPEHRYRGIGRWLMSMAEEWAKKRGYDAISLSVGAGNQDAMALYKESGFNAENIRMTRRIKNEDR